MFKEIGGSERIFAVTSPASRLPTIRPRPRDGILAEEECFGHELRFGVVQTNGTLD